MKHAMTCGVCLLSLLSISAIGEEAMDCSAVEDRDERLACFDRQFPKVEEPAAAPEKQAESEPVAAPVPELESKPIAIPVQEKKAPAARAPQESVSVPDEPVGVTGEPETLSKGRLFDRDPNVNLTATIRTIRRGDKQKMVFLLGNDEIWMQAIARQLPFHEGDNVTIKNGFMGGYFMKSESGTSTRVSRIK